MEAAATAQSDAEIKALLDILQRTEQSFISAVNGVSANQAAFRTAPGRWTIAEIAEHIALVEETLLTLLSAPEFSAQEPNRSIDDKIHRHATDRRRPIPAPEFVIPAGRTGVSESIEKFRKGRAQSRELAHKTAQDMRNRRVNHPVAGNIDAYQCMLILAYHPQRHIGQLDEIKAHADYPQGTAKQ
jgi:hypothetical protein